MDQKTWVLVANSSRGRFFNVLNINVLEEMDGLVHCESRMKELELVSDRPGRESDRVGSGRHAMERQTTWKKRASILFAEEVADCLKEAYQEGKVERLYIAAAPSFLGQLRQALDPTVLNIVAGELDKDVTMMSTDEIVQHLPYPFGGGE